MRLELFTDDHKAAIQDLANDPEVSDTSSVDYPFTEEIAQSWIDKNRETPPHELYFVLLNEGAPVGGCALKHIDSEENSAYLGYWIGKRFWGRGLGFQAGQLLRDYAFTELKFDLLHAMCLQASNERSMRILEKIGFVSDTSREPHSTRGRWGERFPGDAWGYYLLTRARWVELGSREDSPIS